MNARYPGEYKSAIARAKKILVGAGYVWSTTTGRYRPFFNEQVTTHGVKIARVGVSNTIALHVHMGTNYDREVMRFVEHSAVEVLRAAGLPFDDRGWLECGGAA